MPAVESQPDTLSVVGGQLASETLETLLASARRQRHVLVAGAVIGFLLGIGFLLQAVPRYTSSTSILIDAKKVGLSTASQLEGTLTFETGVIDSQVQILLSDKLAGNVVDRLGLVNNQAFLDPPKSLIGTVVSGIGRVVQGVKDAFSSDPSPPDLSERPPEVRRLFAVRNIQSSLKVNRVARTYVLNVDFTSDNPMLATTIAGAFADAYLDDQLESKFDATRRASVWMDDRIRDLRAKALAADQAVQAFRARNNLTQASGRLINEQALSDATTQLSLARGELNAAKAKYDRLKQLIDANDTSGSVIESLGNPIISQLRGKFLQAAKFNGDITAKLGENHFQAQNARKEMAQYEKLIFEELTRLLGSYESEVKIAGDKVSSLERSIETMRLTNTADNEAQVKLRALEQDAQTYNNLYTAFLQKFQEATQHETFPVTDARIIAQATVPMMPSSPKTALVLAAALVLGCLGGGAVAAFREFRDRGFRIASQVREELGLEFLAYLPQVSPPPGKGARGRRSGRKGEALVLHATDPVLDYVLNEPLSRYAEAMRAMKISSSVAFGTKRPLLIGFVSAFPNEGKTTTAKNFASLAASQGERVLLIDADLRNPNLTRALAPRATEGLVEILGGRRNPTELMFVEERSGLSFLPGATHKRVPQTGEVLGSERMGRLIESLGERFDTIILDLPPLGAVIDALAVSQFVDGYFLVVEWGKTPRSVVRDMLVSLPAVAEKTIGVVLSKVTLDKLKLYTAYSSYGYTGDYQSRYYGNTSAS